MFDNENIINDENVVEAILFMMGDSVSVDTLATALNKDEESAKNVAETLVDKYENEYKDRGMKIIRINNKYQMVANNKYFTNLVLVASKPQKPILTDSILETLSIIAYKQPITKPEIENIRGVKSDFQCNKLIEYKLVEEKGRLDTAGRPIILGTTEEFLRRFGIENIKDLPTLNPELSAEIEKEVCEELSETFGEPVRIEKDKNEIESQNENNEKFENKKGEALKDDLEKLKKENVDLSDDNQKSDLNNTEYNEKLDKISEEPINDDQNDKISETNIANHENDIKINIQVKKIESSDEVKKFDKNIMEDILKSAEQINKNNIEYDSATGYTKTHQKDDIQEDDDKGEINAERKDDEYQ